MGGKQRLVKHIAPIINSVIGSRPFVSPFVGGGSIEAAVTAKSKHCNDANPYLIAMYNKCKAHGTDWLPSDFSEDEYKALRADKEGDPALAGFVVFACCFAGKFFQGYARGGGFNYADNGKRGLAKRFDGLKDATFSHGCYSALTIPEDALIYCDPPYAKTTGYAGAKDIGFCSVAFHDWARTQVAKGCIVLISEIESEPDFIPIWSRPFTRGLRSNGKNVKSSESLFVHESQAHMFSLL